MSEDHPMTAYGRRTDDTAELDLVRDVDLDEDPFADDLTDQLAEKAPRRFATRTTAILGAALLLVVGFVGGAQVQKHWGKNSSQAASPFSNLGGPRAGASGFPGFGGSVGGQGQSSAGGATTTGTVKLVDGKTVYLQTADGNVVTVRTSGSTSVQLPRAGSLKDLTAGATVSVDGQTGSDGTVTATRITRTK
jgi:hypothetical protein